MTPERFEVQQQEMGAILAECARLGGEILLRHYGKVQRVEIKENQSSVVTEADLASEHVIVERITRSFPDHNLIAEEAGRVDRGSEWTWVIDPLDGTSNFAVGLPWFGVMIAVAYQDRPRQAVMFLPLENRMYVAAEGGGASCNGQPVKVTSQSDLSRVLCACGLDASSDPRAIERQASFLGRLVQAARNIRATNSLIDFAYTVDGRLGAAINHNMKIWDIAAPWLILREAGAVVTDLAGRELQFNLGPGCASQGYAVAGANPRLLRQILELARASQLVDVL